MNNLEQVFLVYYTYVKSKENEKLYNRILKNIEEYYFHIVLDKEHNVYYFEIASGWNIPKYVKENIKIFMKKLYNADYYIKEKK